MNFLTLTDLITRVDQRLNLEGESFVTYDEKVNYINEAVKDIEGEIHKLQIEDNYFLASQPLSLVVDQQSYSLPVNIYGNKITSIMYHGDDKVYEIRRMRRSNATTVEAQIAYITKYCPNQEYQYIVKNDSVAFGNEIQLHPKSRETSTENATIWYIREANTLSAPTDLCDIPEGYPYVVQYTKCECLAKEFMGQVPPQELAKLASMRDNLIAYLTEMVPDQNNQIDQDLTFYNEFDYYNGIYGMGWGY